MGIAIPSDYIELFHPEDDPHPKIDLSAQPELSTSPDVLKARAVRAGVATGSGDITGLTQQLQTNQGESDLRQNVASSEDQKNYQTRAQIIDQIVKSGQLQQRKDIVLGLTQPQNQTNPETVLENLYAKNTVNYIATQDPSSETITEAAKAPEEHMQRLDVYQLYLAKQEVARRMYENVAAQYQGLNIAQKGWYMGKSVLNPFNAWSNIPGAYFAAEGTNVEKHIQDLYNHNVGLDEFTDRLKQDNFNLTSGTFGNLEDVVSYLDNVVSGSNSTDQFNRNLMFYLNIGSMPFVGKIVKGAAGAAVGLTKGIAAELGGAYRVAQSAKAAQAARTSEAISKSIVPMTSEVDEAAQFTKSGDVAFNEGDQNVYKIDRPLSAVVQANAEKSPSAERLLGVAGDTETAAKLKASTNIENAKAEPFLKDADEIQANNFKQLSDYIPGFQNPERYMIDGDTASAEMSRRIFQHAKDALDLAKKAVNLRMLVSRATTEAESVGSSEADAFLRTNYTTANSAVVDTRFVPAELNPATNTGYQLADIGLPNGEGLPSRDQAITFAKDTLGLRDQYTIEPRGNKYYITVRKDLDETTEGFKAAMMTTDNTSPLGMPSRILGLINGPRLLNSLKGAKAQLGQFQNEQRATAVSASNALENYMSRLGKSFSRERLSSPEYKALNRILALNNELPDPDFPMNRGFYYKTPHDLQQAYLDVHHRMPTEREILGYFDNRTVNQLDYIFRNFGLYRDKSIAGYATYNITSKSTNPLTGEVDEAADFTKRGYASANEGDQNVYTHQNLSFDGKDIPGIPYDQPNTASIVIRHSDGRTEQFTPGRMSQEQVSMVKGLKADGYKYIKLFDPTDKEVPQKLGVSGPVQYVVTKDAKYQPLSWTQIPYRPGGHVKYRNNFFVKQPIVSYGHDDTPYHAGDTTAFGVETKSKAIKVMKAMEDARVLYNSGDKLALQKHIEKNLPLEWNADTLSEKFQNGTYDPKMPFTWTFQGKTTADAGVTMNGLKLRELVPGIRQIMDSDVNDKVRLDREFIGQRDFNLDSIKNTGTESSPVYHLDVPQLVDPLKMTQEAMSGIIKNRFFRDYKIQAAQSFVQEFGHGQDAVLSDAYGNAVSDHADPVGLMLNGKIPVDSDNFSRAIAAKIIRSNIRNLLNQDSLTQKVLNVFKMSMKELAYNGLGDKASRFITNSELSMIKDPFAAMRGIAFHTKLGFWNPVQMFVQSQTLANISAIAPRYGARSWLPSLQMRRLDLNSQPEVVNHIAEISDHPSLGMSKAQFLDSYKWLKDSGYDIVGREYSWRDSQEDNLFHSTTGRVLESGTMFFKGTERLVRINAWNAAYLEHVTENGLTKIGLRDSQKILSRANDMAGNMTRDANAFWQRGLASNLTQFFGYNARITDLMLGKQLSKSEKLRMFGMFSMMYGMPVAVNSYTPILPVFQSIRAEAIKNNIDINNYNSWESAIFNGLPAATYAMVTGETPNVGERYGPSGNTIISDLLSGNLLKQDYTFTENLLRLATGASGGIVSDSVKAANPFLVHLTDLFNSDHPSTLRILLGDIVNAGKEISTVNTLNKTWVALQTGNWVSKHGTVLADNIDPAAALTYGASGLQPQEVSDMFLRSDINSDWTAYQASIEKDLVGDMRDYLTYLDEGSTDSAEYMESQIRTKVELGGFDALKAQEILSQAYKSDPITRRILDKFLKSGAPADLQKRLEMELQIEQRQNESNQ